MISGKLGLSKKIKTKQVFVVFDWKENISIEEEEEEEGKVILNLTLVIYDFEEKKKVLLSFFFLWFDYFLFISRKIVKINVCNTKSYIVSIRKAHQISSSNYGVNRGIQDKSVRGNFHLKSIRSFLSHFKELVKSLEKRDCFDHVVFKQGSLYFRWQSKKVVAIPFCCTK